jgi:biopolymer transport protein ExbB
MHRLLLLCGVILALAQVAPVLAADVDGEQSMSLFQMFFWSGDPLGIVVIWMLLLMSMFSIGYSIKVFINYRKSTLIPEAFHDQIETMIKEKRYREAIDFSASDPSYLAKLVSSALHEANNGFRAMERAVEETGDAETTRMLRPIEYLNVVGNISPMMGLFGTVYGMIRAFQVLVAVGGRPDPGLLAAGISTALVTTFWGLIVAIPALAVYALIRNKIDALSSEGVIQAEQLLKPFKPSGRKRTGGGSRATTVTDAGD